MMKSPKEIRNEELANIFKKASAEDIAQYLKVYRDKEWFVCFTLWSLAYNLGVGITDIRYEINLEPFDHDKTFEWVTVTYKTGHEIGFPVDADNNVGILKDFMKYIIQKKH